MNVDIIFDCIPVGAIEMHFSCPRAFFGIPLPADKFVRVALDLNKDLIRHPNSTFFVRVSGDSMRDAGIVEGDILIVDTILQPRPEDIVIALLDGELTVKRYREESGRVYLVPENKNYRPIEILAHQDFRVLGVALHAIHPLYH